MGPTPVHVVAARVLVVALAVVAPMLAAPSAHAAAYRYWSYWWGASGEWTYASAGAAAHRPDDGTVEGWRFAVSGDGAAAARSPRALPDFAALCGSTPAVDGRKRVGVVIDYGTAADAPSGEDPPAARGACAVVAPTATGAAVLAAVGAYRVDAGLVCGIDGYPARECADLVTAAPTPTRSSPGAATSAPAPVTTAAPGTPATRGATTSSAPAAPRTSATTGRSATPSLTETGTTATTSPPATASPSASVAGASPAGSSEAASGSTADPSPGESLVALSTAPASTSSGAGGPPVGVIVGVLLVGALAGVGAWLTRRSG